MHIIKKGILFIEYILRIKSSVSIAKKIGVNFKGKVNNCRVLDNPFRVFGTEPWLITIGTHVEITNGVRFITHDGSIWCFREQREFKNKDYMSPIKIGNNVFIGTDSIILPGVTIGDNCIIGAGSIVNKNVPDNSIFAGVPAKFIKTIDQFKDDLRESRLIDTKNLSENDKKTYIKKYRPDWIDEEV